LKERGRSTAEGAEGAEGSPREGDRSTDDSD
jgi:hypothetical protein